MKTISIQARSAVSAKNSTIKVALTWLKSKIYANTAGIIITLGIIAGGAIEADSYITAAVCLLGLVITSIIGKEPKNEY